MRIKIKRLRLLFALIPIISIAFYILTVNNDIYADQSFVEFDIYQLISQTQTIPNDSVSPDEYSPLEVFAVANQKYLQTDAVKRETNGTVTALGFYKQTVMNTLIKKDGHIFSESVSLSAIASVAEERYFRDGAILYRPGVASGNAVKSWSNDISELSTSTYRRRYGVVPQEITKYSVTENSVLSSSYIGQNEDGTYTFELVLDADKAYKYTRYEMMTYAGVTAFPEYYTCRMVFTIDEDWRMVHYEAYDTYKIALMGGVKCDSVMNDTFTYDNVEMPERAQPFIDYEIKGVTDPDIGDKGKGPADYLNEAFGDYIAGTKPLALTADVTLMGQTLSLALDLDITSMNARFSLGDEIYGAYKDSTVYLALGDNKFSLALSDLGALGIDIGGGEISLSGDLLMTLFENYSITHTATHTHILMPFAMFGLDFDIDMGLKITEDGTVTADTIDATIGIGSFDIEAHVQIQDSVNVPTVDESEFTPLQPLLQAIGGTISAPAYDITGEVNVTTESMQLPVDVAARIVKAQEGVQVEGNIGIAGILADVVYVDDTIYAKVGNIGVKTATADIGELIAAVTDFLGYDVQLPAIDTSDITGTVSALLGEGTSLADVLHLLTQIEYADNTLTVTLPVNGATVRLDVTHDDTLLRSLTLSGLHVSGIDIEADLTLAVADATPVTVDADAYADAQVLTALLPTVKEMINAQSYCATVESSITVNETPLSLSASLTVNRDPFAIEADITIDNTTVSLVYDDDVLYITADEFAAKLTISEAMDLIAEYIPAPLDTLSDVLALLPDISGNLDITELLSEIYLTSKDDAPVITVNIGNTTLHLTLYAANSTLGAEIRAVENDADVLTLTADVIAFAATQTIVPKQKAYLDIMDLLPFVTSAVNTAQARIFTFDLTGTISETQDDVTLFESFKANVNIDATDGLRLVGSLQLSEQTVRFAYADQTAYLQAGAIGIKMRVGDATTLKDAFLPLLDDAKVFADTIAPLLGLSPDDIAAVFARIDELIGTLKGENNAQGVLDTLGSFDTLLPALNAEGIVSLLAGVRVQDNTLSLSVHPQSGAPYTVTLSHDGEYLTALTIDGLMINTLQLCDVQLSVACNADDFALPAVNDSEYADVAVLAEFAPSLSKLLRGKNFEWNVSAGEINTAVISGDLSGKVQISLAPLCLQADLTFRKHNIFFTYRQESAYGFESDTFYIAVNNIRLQFTLNDIKTLAAELEKYLADNGIEEGEIAVIAEVVEGTAQSLSLLENLLGGKTLADTFGLVNYFGEVEHGYRVGFNLGELSLALELAANDNGLRIDVYNFNYGEILSDSFVQSTLYPIASLDAHSESASDYIKLIDLKEYIAPVAQTLQHKYYALSFTGSVIDAEEKETTIDGALKIQRKDGQRFADVYAEINLGGKTGDMLTQSTGGTLPMKLYIIETPSDESVPDITAYIDYNGFTAKIDYRAALGILGSVCEILNLDIPMLQEIYGSVYTPVDTDVFKTMEIVGLDGIRDTIKSLFSSADEVKNAAQGSGNTLLNILGMIPENMVDKALEGISLQLLGVAREENETSLPTKLLHVRLDNGILPQGVYGNMADIVIGHNRQALTYVSIDNLTANGDTVTFRADITFEGDDIVAPSGKYYDFSSANDLLYSVIKTASMREFHITGSVHLDILNLISTNLGIDATVKILDDGSTVAAVKLAVPYFVGLLTKSDSYIYYANNMLYFVVDTYKNNGDSPNGTETKIATVEEFLANPFDYVFYLIRLSSSIQNTITDAMNKSGGTPSNDPKQILTNYAYNSESGQFDIRLNLAKLAGSSDLSDLDITLSTSDGYIDRFQIKTKFVGLITVTFNDNGAKLNNFARDEQNHIIGSTRVSPIGYGVKFANRTDLSYSIDTIEDDLVILAPAFDSAYSTLGYDTLTEKAGAKAANTTNAAKRIDKAVSALDESMAVYNAADEAYTAAQQKYDEMKENYLAAQAKADAADKDALDYDRIVRQAAYAKQQLERAESALKKAEKNKTVAADRVLVRIDNVLDEVNDTVDTIPQLLIYTQKAMRAAALNTKTYDGASNLKAGATALQTALTALKEAKTQTEKLQGIATQQNWNTLHEACEKADANTAKVVSAIQSRWQKAAELATTCKDMLSASSYDNTVVTKHVAAVALYIDQAQTLLPLTEQLIDYVEDADIRAQMRKQLEQTEKAAKTQAEQCAKMLLSVANSYVSQGASSVAQAKSTIANTNIGSSSYSAADSCSSALNKAVSDMAGKFELIKGVMAVIDIMEDKAEILAQMQDTVQAVKAQIRTAAADATDAASTLRTKANKLIVSIGAKDTAKKAASNAENAAAQWNAYADTL